MRKSVCYIGNANVYHMMKLSVKSLLYHNDIDAVYFLIDDECFPVPLPENGLFHCIDMRGQKFFREGCPNIRGDYTYLTLLRSVLSKILSEEDHVLLLDPDTVIYGDISKIWNTKLGKNFFAAVPETRNSEHDLQPYYNAGVMLMNLNAFRREYMDDRLIVALNERQFQHLEQDALNELCKERILPLSSDYNASFVTDETDNPLIKHFLSTDKHLFIQNAKRYAAMTWDDILSRPHEQEGITG